MQRRQLRPKTIRGRGPPCSTGCCHGIKYGTKGRTGVLAIAYKNSPTRTTHRVWCQLALQRIDLFNLDLAASAGT